MNQEAMRKKKNKVAYFSNVFVPLLRADADFYCFLHEAG